MDWAGDLQMRYFFLGQNLSGHCSVTLYLTAARVCQSLSGCVAPAMHPQREKAPGCRELESESLRTVIGSG